MIVEPIVAVATPRGRGGIGIVRISGTELESWLPKLFDRPAEPRRACHGNFTSALGEVIDEGILLFFPAPASFTGEDVIELQGHGSAVLLDALVKRAVALGARLARPGEFSERAFLNGKLDLVQAEAVADLIAADSEAAAKAALRSLQGEFSSRIQRLARSLTDLRVMVETDLDFSDQDIDLSSLDSLQQRLNMLLDEVVQVISAARQGSQLRDGFRVAIVGRPNAGKSRLLNALAGQDRAIVTAIPGTTRDILREMVNLDGIALELFDTAGLRETRDVVELEGMRRAREVLTAADSVLLVVDSRDCVSQEDVEAFLLAECPEPSQRDRVTLVYSKIDLSGVGAGFTHGTPPSVAVSAVTGAGLDSLRTHLAQLATSNSGTEGQFMARRRHVRALEGVQEHVQHALARIDDVQLELAAEELRRAHQELGSITGEFSSDALLGEIFAGFCIGK